MSLRTISRADAGLTLLRLGLAVVFLWFGLSQVLDAHHWGVLWVHDWVSDLTRLPAEIVVSINGSFEVVFGTLLALGIRTRAVAAALALHTTIIAIYVGYNEIGVRDFGLAISTAALALLVEDKKN